MSESELYKKQVSWITIISISYLITLALTNLIFVSRVRGETGMSSPLTILVLFVIQVRSISSVNIKQKNCRTQEDIFQKSLEE
jgi:hypothetical protein